MADHATVPPPSSLTCGKCGDVFTSRNKLFKHVRFAHTEDKSTDMISAQGADTGDEAQPQLSTPRPPLHIYYQDEFIMVLVKPQGMATMGVFQNNNSSGAVAGSSSSGCKRTADDDPKDTSHLSGEARTKYFHERHEQKRALSVPTEETVMNSDLLLLQSDVEYQRQLKARRALEEGQRAQKPYRKAVPVHRLDRCTGGLLLCSKSAAVEKVLRRLFKENSHTSMAADAASSSSGGSGGAVVVESATHLVRKRYRCLVGGLMPPELGGLISLPVDGRVSVTRFEVVKVTRSAAYGGWLSTLDCFPLTGRRHQIRKHLVAVGRPIIGDPRYTRAVSWPAPMPVDPSRPPVGAPGSAAGSDLPTPPACAAPSCESLTQRHCCLDPPFFLWAVELNFPTIFRKTLEVVGADEVDCDHSRFTTVVTEEPAFYGAFRDIQQADFEARLAAGETEEEMARRARTAAESVVCRHG
jgi:23S rRNA-/tRNA-specific pseudouridylate synthase